MASINKLSIRGVRSFSPDDAEQVVEFFFPITVIVGNNGCGKTTIIESLKYAITGALPPGTRSGQAFVHDAKSMGRPNIKAHVKLRLTSRNGSEMVVIRSMEVTQKKTTASFKQLDGVLRSRDPETGERIALSQKCSELDRFLPQHFGVAKPILEHVLFCHQEDASWPLQEGAVLKKRFDEIFDSTRYTKALDVFRKTEKEMASTVKDLKADLASLKSHKHAAHGFLQDLQERQDQEAALDEQRKAYQEDIETALAEIQATQETIAQIDEYNAELQRLGHELSQLQSVADHQTDMLEENMLDKPLKSLKDKLADFDASMVSQVEALEELQADYQRCQKELDDLGRQEVQIGSLMGKQQAEQQAHEERLRERYEKMEQCAKTYNLDPSLTATLGSQSHNNTSFSQATTSSSETWAIPILPQDMAKFLQELERKGAELKEKLKQHRDRAQKEEDVIQGALTSIVGQLSSVEKERDKLAREKNAALQEQSQLSKEARHRATTTKSQVEEAKRLADAAAKQVEEADKNPRSKEIPAEIREYETKIEDLKRKMDEDKIILDTLRYTADTQNSIGILQDQCSKDVEILQDGLHEHSSMMQKYNIQYVAELPRDGDDNGEQVLGAVEQIMDSTQSKYSDANNNLSKAIDEMNKSQRAVSEMTALKNSQQQNMAATRAKLSTLQNGPVARVRELVETMRKDPSADGVELSDEHPRNLLKFIDNALRVAEDKAPPTKDFGAVAKIVFKKLKKKAKPPDGGDSVICPCCTRPMNDAEAKACQDQINLLAQEFVEAGVNQAKMEAYEKRKQVLEGWRKIVVDNTDGVRDFYRHSAEADDLEKELEARKTDLASLQSKLDDQKGLEADLQTEVDELRVLVDQCRRWTEDAGRLAEKRMQINQKRLDLSAGTLHDDRDLRTVERDLQKRADEKDDLGNKISRLNREMTNMNSNSTNATKVLAQRRERVVQLEEKFATEQKAAVRKKELIEKLQKMAEEEKQLQDQIAPLKQKEHAKKSERQRARAHASEQDAKLSEAVNIFNSDTQQLDALVRKIDEYTESGKMDELARLTEKVAVVKERIEGKKKEMEAIKPKVDDAQKAVDDSDRHKKQILANISILEGGKRIAHLEKETVRIESERDSIEGYATIYENHQSAIRRKEKATTKQAKLEGRWHEIVESVRSLKRKLSAPEYKNVDEQCRVAEIKHATTQIAAEDLKKYYTALDKALLQFHGKKIAEINKIIREIWMLTYKGEDINNIEIVSGEEAGSRAQKSYNYRVVMTKGSSQMDMRGRCSAGQRVLASIVIRLALAETFGIQCGCIALDEPTVNLDYRNKQGLAVSLAKITALRAQQRNFQLILITHDEEFVSMMKSELSSTTGFSMPEKYFHVSRKEGQDGKFYSKIEAKDWEDL